MTLKAPQDMSRLFVKRNNCTGTARKVQRGHVTHRGIESCRAFFIIKMLCMTQYLYAMQVLYWPLATVPALLPLWPNRCWRSSSVICARSR